MWPSLSRSRHLVLSVYALAKVFQSRLIFYSVHVAINCHKIDRDFDLITSRHPRRHSQEVSVMSSGSLVGYDHVHACFLRAPGQTDRFYSV